jgi:ElaB/YqjD/DUF883 family membrane-anchored ribosome-binding protein
MTDDATTRIAADMVEGYEDVARGLARMTKHLSRDAGDALSKAAADFLRAAAELAEQTKKQSESLARKAGEEVREHPIAAAAIAATAAGLVGYALTHRAKRSQAPRHPRSST